MKYATVPGYAMAITKLETELAEKEAHLKALKAELAEMVGTAFAAEYQRKGKDHGSLSLEVDGVPLTYELKQTVSWDQAKLKAIWQSIPIDVGDKLIDLKYSVKEKMFDALLDEDLKKKLIDARTTKLSAPLVKIKITE